MNKQFKEEFSHPLAFCLIPYANDDGDAEVIWNSRDGGIPTHITGFVGRSMFPILGSTSVRAKYYVPPLGSTIIADPGFETMVERVWATVETSWNDPHKPMRRHPLFSRLGMLGTARMIAFVRENREAGEPLVVSSEMHAHFLARSRARTIGRSNLPSELAAKLFPVDVESRIEQMRRGLWRKAAAVGDRVTKVAVSAATGLVIASNALPIV